jgi:hypothetical protein
MTMSSPFIVVFCNSRKSSTKRRWARGSWLFCATQEKQIDDELCNLLLSSTPKEKNHKMMMSWEACCRLL